MSTDRHISLNSYISKNISHYAVVVVERFGSSCQFRCKEAGRSNEEEGCKGRQFCLRDPYGCSCSAGFSGLKCINGKSIVYAI